MRHSAHKHILSTIDNEARFKTTVRYDMMEYFRTSKDRGKTTTSPSNTSNSERSESKPVDRRYQHDMEIAKAMRQGMQKRKQGITEADVLLGLQGLDEAENLLEKGDLKQALKISELSLELLIEFLKTDRSTLPTITREVVSARVASALTEAEEMKRILKTPSSRQTSPSSQSQANIYPSRTTSQALSDALMGAAKKIRQNTISKPSQASGQSTSSAANMPDQKVSSPQHSTVSSQPQFYKSQNPLVQTIKSELYVDHSQLNTQWDDIAGLKEAKQKLQESAILPLVRPDLFTGLRKPRNILLYGPPGTGKTMLVKAVARESQCLLFICTASTLTSKWHGEGEKLLRTLFQVARAAAPSIIFVDEMDALLSNRKSDGEHEASRRFKTEFMTQCDGIVKESGTNENGKHLLLIACTNCPWDVDAAVLRRFPTRIYIPLPDSYTRKTLLENLLPKAGKHNLASSDIKAIAKRLHGFSGSDISSIASEASFGPLRSLGGMDAIRRAREKDIRPINISDFESAIDQSTKSVPKDLLKKYDEWKKDQAAS